MNCIGALKCYNGKFEAFSEIIRNQIYLLNEKTDFTIDIYDNLLFLYSNQDTSLIINKVVDENYILLFLGTIHEIVQSAFILGYILI